MINKNRMNEYKKYLMDKKKLQQHIKQLKQNPNQLKKYLEGEGVKEIDRLIKQDEVFLTEYLINILKIFEK